MKTKRVYENYIEFSELVGKTLVGIKRYEGDYEERIEFTTNGGVTYVQYHEQDCCEHVYVEDINGDLQGLLGSRIVKAEETSNSGYDAEHESYTWTFYHIVAENGTTVTIRWNGESNGEYSEGTTMRKYWDEPTEVI